MRFLDVATALGALSFFSPAANGSPVKAELAERQSPFFVVTGATTGGAAPRLEVRDLVNNPDQWNLFLLAMQRFQSQSQSDRVSYYQVSGIHGRPYSNWDGVGPYGPSPWWPAFCPHSSNLFGAWHRPYLALFEQMMLQHANAIVGETPAGAIRSRFQTAVRTLRYPYWDWARRTSAGIIPSALTQPNIQVTFPQNGSTTGIPNPLYSYRFQVVPDNGFDGSFSRNRQTTRAASAESNLQSSYISRRNTLLTLLSRSTSYNSFSTDGNGNRSPNLEAIHNSIHVSVGGYMSQIAYSAFDPIFSMHHMNVDRIIAIWQALNPGSWVLPAVQGSGTRTIAPNSIQDGNSPLTPFHRDSRGTFWTSNAVRDTTGLGYTYPDLVNVNTQQLIASINGLYGNSATNGGLRGGSDGDVPPVTYDYMALVTAQKDIMNGESYAVQFSMAGDYCGSWAALPTPQPPGGQRPVTNSSGTVMFTDALAQRGIDTSDRNGTETYLANNLKWQIVQNDKLVNNVPGVNVTIASTEVKPAKARNQFPVWLAPPQAISNDTAAAS